MLILLIHRRDLHISTQRRARSGLGMDRRGTIISRDGLSPFPRPVRPDHRHEDAQHRMAGSSGLDRSEEHTSELQSLMRISYAVFCLKKKKKIIHTTYISQNAHNL